MTKVRVGPVTVDLLAGDGICSQISRKGDFEPQSLAAWAEIVKPGSVVLDIGAYTGLYAIAAEKLGARLAMAFEPLPSLHERLGTNVKQNGCCVILHKIALSDRAGSDWLYYSGATRLTSAATLIGNLPKVLKGRWTKVKVELQTLDWFGYSDVSAIKIDAERAELMVLRGARETLERCRPAIIVEDLDKELREESVWSTVLPKGYELVDRKLDGGRNLLFMSVN